MYIRNGLFAIGLLGLGLALKKFDGMVPVGRVPRPTRVHDLLLLRVPDHKRRRIVGKRRDCWERNSLDYVDGLMGRGFTVVNPTYASAGGCGGGCSCGGH